MRVKSFKAANAVLGNASLAGEGYSSQVLSQIRQARMSNETQTSGIQARKLKILMLHGYTQNGDLFSLKTKALQKSLSKHFPPAPKPGHLKEFPGGLDFVFPTGPTHLDVTDIPGYDGNDPKESSEAYGWWRRKGDGQAYVYQGIEEGLETVADALKSEGPFDGVLGFSQGGALAGMVTSLLESTRREVFDDAEKKGGMPWPKSFISDDPRKSAIHPPLRFGVSYSGFAADNNALYAPFYEPKITTPVCHFIGSVDTVVSEERSLHLLEGCADGRGSVGQVSKLIYHPGGHFLPSGQTYVTALAAFIRAVLEPSKATDQKEESVEDMDLPF
jgi:hypothetical protein